MNKAQRVILKLMLIIAMLLYPPYAIRGGYHARELGHDWLFAENPAGVSGAHISLVTLAAQFVIVLAIGLAVVLLAKYTTGDPSTGGASARRRLG